MEAIELSVLILAVVVFILSVSQPMINKSVRESLEKTGKDLNQLYVNQKMLEKNQLQQKQSNQKLQQTVNEQARQINLQKEKIQQLETKLKSSQNK